MSIAIKSARARTQGALRAPGGMGDPGLFSFLGGIAKRAVSFIPGVGPIISTAMDVLSPGQRPGVAPRLPIPSLRPGGPGQQVRAFGTPGIQAPAGAVAEAGIGCPSGYHPNKSDYFLKDGSYVPKGSRCVKNRRRNPMNARALSSAVTRINGGKRFQHTLAEIETSRFTKAGNKKAHTH